MEGEPQLEFLSGAWLSALAEAVAASLPRGLPASIALGQVVTGVVTPGEPDGSDVRYTLEIGPGSETTVTPGSTDGAEVVLSTSYGSARALARGDTSAAQLLEQGLVRIGGDARRLVQAADLLGTVGDALTALRGRTAFP